MQISNATWYLCIIIGSVCGNRVRNNVCGACTCIERQKKRPQTAMAYEITKSCVEYHSWSIKQTWYNLTILENRWTYVTCHEKMFPIAVATSIAPDQPAHPHSLIMFAVHHWNIHNAMARATLTDVLLRSKFHHGSLSEN